MDNPLEILIYLFIIISFLSSLFRKKKKREIKTGEQTERPSLEPQPNQKSPQQEDYDILREVEKMFKTETSYSEKEEEKTVEAENKFESAKEHFETADWHEQTETEHKSTLSEHSFESWEDKARKAEEKRKAVNEKIVKQAEMFEKNLRKRSFQQTDIKKTIRQKLRQPISIKEYIIFSEILGKPKSFQE